jgi:hypothetical protein
VQISPWMSLHSWPRGLQISFVITSRFIYTLFLSPYPVTVDEKLYVSLPQGHRLDVSERIDLRLLTETYTRTQLKISQVPTVQSEFRSFKLHQTSKCTHRVIGAHDRVFGIVSRLRPGRSGARIPAGARHFLLSISCGLALGTTQPPIQRVYSTFMPSWRVEGTPLPLLLLIVWALYCWDFALAMKIFALLYNVAVV